MVKSLANPTEIIRQLNAKSGNTFTKLKINAMSWPKFKEQTYALIESPSLPKKSDETEELTIAEINKIRQSNTHINELFRIDPNRIYPNHIYSSTNITPIKNAFTITPTSAHGGKKYRKQTNQKKRKTSKKSKKSKKQKK